MSLSNPSQLLLRNIDLLTAKQPLFVNAPADNLINEYRQHNPSAELSCLNYNYQEHLHIQSTVKTPIHCHFTAHYHCPLKHDLVIIFFPKSKQELTYTLAMLANAIANEATLLLVGENKGGIKSTPKLAKDYLNNCSKVDSARHCSLFSATFCSKTHKSFTIDDWFNYYQFTQQNITLTIATLAGVFSYKNLDIGTRLLLDNLPNNIAGKILDFGCGSGVISAFIGKKYPQAQLSLLDVNALALASARKTLQLNQLTGDVFASDGLSQVKGKYQHIVSNPPFHQGIKTSYSATENFLIHIKQFMLSHADITIVANDFLRYKDIMEQYIAPTKALTNQQGFTIYYGQINEQTRQALQY